MKIGNIWLFAAAPHQTRPCVRSKQDKEHEHRPQGVYTDVHDQGGAERDTVLRRL